MKSKFVYLTIGLLAISPLALQAEDKPVRPDREELKKLTPEERKAKMKELREKEGAPQGADADKMKAEMDRRAKEIGLDPEELKKLSPEERRAKMREAFQKKNEELKKKETDGTLTEEEKKQLARMEEMKKRFESHRREGGEKPERDARPGPDAAKEKK